jgi:hypothetical protein
MSPFRSTPAHQRVVIGRSAAGLPRTYRLIRTHHSSWTAQLVAGLRGLLS